MTQLHRRLDFLSKRARRGVSLLWIIIAFPALVLFLVFAVEIGNIWLARVELEQSLEANALAAVKHWAESGLNEEARMVGNSFSIANPVRSVPVDLTMPVLNVEFDGDLNYDVNQPNGNKVCTDISDYGNYNQSGVLVFGVIREFEGPAGPPAGSVIFNSVLPPNCSTGGVLVDATGEGNLDAQNNEWGISFLATEDNINTSLRIYRVEIDVDANPMMASGYIFQPGSAQLADDNADPFKIDYANVNQSPLEQPNNNFLAGRNTTVTFTESGDTLEIEFSSSGTDTFLGLAPGERIRFGGNVLDGTSQVDGTEVADVTEVRVFYATGNVQDPTPETGFLIEDTTGGATAQCRKRAQDRAPVLDALNQLHVVGHELPIIDLPCPPNSGAMNGQSWVQIGGSGTGLPFAVRAQATIGVPSVIQSICGFDLGPWGVSAKSTAYYDCVTRDPKLIRVDDFECTDP